MPGVSDKGDDSDVVLTGLSGRLPDSDSIEEFARQLFAGEDLVSADERRWTPGLYGLPERSGKLKDLTHFDASFFGVLNKQADHMNPQLRLLLEVTHEVLVDAGLSPAELRGSRTGVYVGVSASDTFEPRNADVNNITGYAITGCTLSMLPNRVSYAFDLKGPSLAIDTGCSSSMVALTQAANAIRVGHCDAAIVAGTSLCLQPSSSLNLHRLGILSPEGRCAAFDSSANGYVRSEAVVAVLLQRRRDARRLYCTVRGGRVNNDGYKEQGITYPLGAMQSRLAAETFEEARLRPADVAYLEAHGTGTKVGDPEEVNAIAELFCKNRQTPLLLGSVKSNMGHSEPACGLCSIAKVVLAMESGVIPANLHFKSPNINIPALSDGRIKVVDRNTKWQGGLVALNSFGFGGVNAHVILESQPGARPPPAEYPAPRLVLASGRTEEAVERLLKLAAEHQRDAELHALMDAVHARAVPRHPYRGYAVLDPSHGTPPVIKILESDSEPRPIWFIFDGMGSQCPGVGRTLLRLPAFAASVARSAAALEPYGVDILHLISEAPAAAFDVINSFVSIVAVQVALVDVLYDLGVRPDGIIGSSFGEIGCAYADGALSAEQALLCAYWRGRSVMEAKLAPGAMAVVGVSWEKIKGRCPADIECVSIHMIDNILIAGSPASIDEVVAELTAEGVFVKHVNSLGVAFHHSKLVAAAAPLLHASLLQVIFKPKPRSARWLSTSVPQDQWNSDQAKLSDAAYFVNNLLSPVQFSTVMPMVPERALVVELAPHALSQALLRRALPGANHVPLLRLDAPDALSHLLCAVGQIFAAGAQPQVSRLYPSVSWPVSRGTPALASHVGWDHSVEWSVPHFSDCCTSENFIEYDLSKPDDAYIADQNIDGRILFPAAGYLGVFAGTSGSSGQPGRDSTGDEVTRVNSHLGSSHSSNEDTAVVTCFSKGQVKNQVLLPTVIVNVESRTGQYRPVRALLDQGSQACFVTEATVQGLGLQKTSANLTISGVGGDQRSMRSKALVTLKIQPLTDPNFKMELKCFVLTNITSLLPERQVLVPKWVQLNNLCLADPNFDSPNKIDILLGAEVYSQILKDGVLRGTVGSTVAQCTSLGWILSGPTGAACVENKISAFHTQVEENEIIKKFWELENEPLLSTAILTKEEQRCDDIFSATTRRDEEGRYAVKLPFRDEEPTCKNGNSREIAIKRLKSLERKTTKNKILKERYTEVINEYLQLGHMTLVPEQELNVDSVYLPHHAVVREDKSTTKVRVVFDASCKNENGISLNDNLMVGPTLQPDLRHLIMSWRKHPVCLIADIAKMYRMVKVTEEDCDFQRIVWRTHPEDEVRDYKLLTVTFGTASAPYLAVKALNQVAIDHKEAYPMASERVAREFYMDDLMTGCQTTDEGIRLYNEMNALLKEGGFILQKWSSNDDELLKIIDQTGRKEDSKLDKTLELKQDNIVKILGLTWNRSCDEFQYSVKLPPLSAPVTKRKIISDVARLFDPLGWIAPCVIKAKIFIQRLWIAGTGWDEEPPTSILEDWYTYRNELAQLTDFRIPRWMFTKEDDVVTELHGFSDASNVAYAAVVYMRVVDAHGEVHVVLISAKTRVSPVRQISIPRLELCGAVLLAKLLVEIADVLDIPRSNIRAWTDSTVVLAWLNKHPSNWKTFVANRISEIHSTLETSQWSHVSTKDNPADCASRGVQPSELADLELWKFGVKFLWDKVVSCKKLKDNDTVEEISTKVHITTTEVSILDKYSSLQKLIRVVAYCRRFYTKKVIIQKGHNVNFLNKWELDEALVRCIRLTQAAEFQLEMREIQTYGQIKTKSSKLLCLTPFIDDNGLLRVDGRISKSQQPESVKTPIILPHRSHFSDLVVDDAHKKTLHGDVQLMLNYIRSAYWVIGVKTLVKHHVRKCVTCVRYKAKLQTQLMGTLPAVRVTPARAILNSGVDYAGPIMLRTSKGRGHKAYKGYVCLFVCMVTKAVHIEVSLVWRTLAKINKLKMEETVVELEKVEFRHATNLTRDVPVLFRITLLGGTGEFEISANGIVVVTGVARLADDPTVERLRSGELVEFDETPDDMPPLEAEDIYLQMRLRGLNHNGVFRGIKSSNARGTRGLIIWNDNWISFIDSMIQYLYIGDTNRDHRLPVRLQRVVIDPVAQRSATTLGGALPINFCQSGDVITAGGVEIRGLKRSLATQSNTQTTPRLEKFIFMPLLEARLENEDTERSKRDALTAALQLAIENCGVFKLNLTEFVLQRSSKIPLLPYVVQLLETEPEVYVTATLVADASAAQYAAAMNPLGIKVSNIDAASGGLKADCDVVLCREALTPDMLATLAAASSARGFVVLEERLRALGDGAAQVLAHRSGLVLVSSVRTLSSEYLLLRRAISLPTARVQLEVPRDDEYSWVEPLKIAMKRAESEDMRVYVWSRAPHSGLLGLATCLRREPGGDRLRFYYLPGAENAFDPDAPAYRDQVQRDLVMNVLRAGIWGTFRHLLLDDTANAIRQVEHAYVKILTCGNLSTLRWIESDMRYARATQHRYGTNLCRVYYAALNFRDVMLATGKLPPDALPVDIAGQECILGLEFSGRSSTGKRVMGIVAAKALATTVLGDEGFMWEVPSPWSLEEAATVPMAYATAYYALIVRGRMRRGESVLVHAGAGGVGQAAIAIALHAGCTVFTTVGTSDKRAFLREHFPQLPDANIGHSRDCGFDQLVLRRTRGHGVDLVLNSLAGDKLQASLRCLAVGGRFLQIGKLDLSNNSALGIAVLLKNTTVHGILLDALFDGDHPHKAKVVRCVTEGIASGAVRPLPATVYTDSQLKRAFRYMATGKHIGKVLIRVCEEEADGAPALKRLVSAAPRTYMHPAKSYVLVGGLGGFGLELGSWLVERGARALVFNSRSGVRTGYQAWCILRWRSAGVRVLMSATDATTVAGARTLLEEAAAAAPVGGVFNLAAVLRAGYLENLKPEDFFETAKPKMNVTAALDQASRELASELDYFVAFSSVASGRGARGMSAYGFANSTMERICERRRADGLPALAVQWGAIGDVGMIVHYDLANRELIGTRPQRIASCLETLDALLALPHAVVASMVVEKRRAKEKLTQDLVSTVANILGIKNVSKVVQTSTLAELGMDSLMRTEIKQTLERSCDVFLSERETRALTFARLRALNDSTTVDKSPSVYDTDRNF